MAKTPRSQLADKKCPKLSQSDHQDSNKICEGWKIGFTSFGSRGNNISDECFDEEEICWLETNNLKLKSWKCSIFNLYSDVNQSQSGENKEMEY